MAKKAPPRTAPEPTIAPRLLVLEERVEGLLTMLDGIESRIAALGALGAATEDARRLALEAVAQAQDVHATCSTHEQRLNHMTLAVAEGIQHVDRAEKRINGAVTRARRQLREAGLEHPGLEAEAADLHVVHGGGGEEVRLPPVPAEMDEAVGEDPLTTRLRQLRLSR